jgi:type I restriction enzyme, S subunit
MDEKFLIGWNYTKLDELGIIRRGRSKHRPRNDPSLYGGSYPLIQTAEVTASEFYIRGFSQTYNETGLAQSRLWEPDTLCIVNAGENTGETAILGFRACFPDSIIGFTAYPEKSDVRFIKYYLSILKTHIRSITKGATQDNLSVEKLLSFDIPSPPFTIQQRIAEILSNYDRLIDNNTRRIALLEESIHRLYQEWFVYLRFPGCDRVKAFDGVPEGWRRVTADQAIDFKPKTSAPKGVERPFVPMDALSTNLMTIAQIDSRPIGGGAKFRNEDTLLARITPCLENGKTAFVQFMDDPAMVASGSTEFIVMRSKQVTSHWVYCLARSYHFRQHAINSMAGSDGRQRVKPEALEQFELLLPPSPILKKFDGIAAPIFRQIQLLSSQTQKLREARDLLLPRLMNGSLSV